MRFFVFVLGSIAIFLPTPNFGQDKLSILTPDEITAPAKQSIDKGLKWLIDHQNADGSWGCQKGEPPSVALTSLAALALMASGSTQDRGPYAKQIQKAVKWVESCQARSGMLSCFDSSGMGKAFEHCCGTLLLSQVYGNKGRVEGEQGEDERRQLALNKSLEELDRLQNDDGGWGGQPKGASEIGVTAMSYLSVRAGNACGARKSKSDMKKLREFVRASLGDGNARIYALTSSLRIEYGMGSGDEKIRKYTDSLLKMKYGQDHGRMSEWDYLAAFYSVGALVLDEKNPAWQRWYTYTRDFLVKIQTVDGCWLIEYCLHCKVFATSLALLALQMPTRILPLYQY
jgi:hypothetical protein